MPNTQGHFFLFTQICLCLQKTHDTVNLNDGCWIFWNLGSQAKNPMGRLTAPCCQGPDYSSCSNLKMKILFDIISEAFMCSGDKTGMYFFNYLLWTISFFWAHLLCTINSPTNSWDVVQNVNKSRTQGFDLKTTFYSQWNSKHIKLWN